MSSRNHLRARAARRPGMVLSHDAVCHSDLDAEADRMAPMPKCNYTHIHDDAFPALREKGVTHDQIGTMLVGNPAPYFGGAFA